jgi:hypothetical protein
MQNGAVRTHVPGDLLPIQVGGSLRRALLVKNLITCVKADSPAAGIARVGVVSQDCALLIEGIAHAVGSIGDVSDEPTHVSTL